MKTERALNRLSICENVHYRKNQIFSWFTINSQSKLKKNSTHYFEIFTKKNSLRNLIRFYGGLFELEILEILTIAFVLRTII